MKKIIVSLVAVATLTISTHAQTRRNHNDLKRDSVQNEGRKHFTKPGHKPMDETIQFSNEQKEQMKAINLDTKEKMKALKSSNLSSEEYNRRNEELHKERKQKVLALMTADQKAKMEQEKKQHGKRKMDHGVRMEKMKEKLELTNEQVTKMNEQRAAFRSKLEAIKNNQALSADDKKSQMKTLKEEQRNSFKSILTPEQAKKVEEMKQKRAGKSA